MLTDEATKKAARALALACNGGDWEKDYTHEQRAMWCRRIVAAMGEK